MLEEKHQCQGRIESNIIFFPCKRRSLMLDFCFRLGARPSGTSGVIRAHLLVLLRTSSGWEVSSIYILIALQGIWIDLCSIGSRGVRGNLSNHWVQETVQIQEIQFPGRTVSFSLQIGAFNIFPLGRLQQDQGQDWGADLPKLLTGGRVWRDTQPLSWFFFYLSLGQFQDTEKISLSPKLSILLKCTFVPF